MALPVNIEQDFQQDGLFLALVIGDDNLYINCAAIIRFVCSSYVLCPTIFDPTSLRIFNLGEPSWGG